MDVAVDQVLATTTLYCPECGYNLMGVRGARCPECHSRICITLSSPSRSLWWGSIVLAVGAPLGCVSPWAPVFRMYGLRGWATLDWIARIRIAEAGITYAILGVYLLAVWHLPSRNRRIASGLIWITSLYLGITIIQSLVL